MAAPRFPGGLNVCGMPITGGSLLTTGDIFFVHSSGSNGNTGTDSNSPKDTIAHALACCSSSTGDIVIVMPGHAETLSSTMTIDEIGVSIIGLGNGMNRPLITTATTGSDDAIDITVADVKIHNIAIQGTNSTGTNVRFINLATGADRAEISHCVFLQQDTNLDPVTIAGGADDIYIHDCKWYAAAAGADTGISIEASVNRPHLENLMFFYTGSAGADEGCIRFEAGGSLDVLVENARAVGLVDGQPFIYASDATTGPTGLLLNCVCDHDDYSDIWDVTPATGLSYINCYGAEPGSMGGSHVGAGSASVHPAVTPTL